LFLRSPRLIALATCLLACINPAFSQTPKSKGNTPAKPAPNKRLPFAQAQQLLVGESEGNLNKRMTFDVVTYTLTRLRNGQVLELFYPVVPNQPAKPGRKLRSATVPGYGVLFESEAVYHDATRPRHALEDLIPDGRAFIAAVPQLVARLEKRLRLGAGKLDYTRASLRRLDSYVAGYRSTHDGAETDAQLFQELAAYYSETLRRTLNADWHLAQERVGKAHVQTEPNLRVMPNSATYSRILKPWSRLLGVLYDEDKRGASVTKAFDMDVAAAQ
jgi:hypothetical protein